MSLEAASASSMFWADGRIVYSGNQRRTHSESLKYAFGSTNSLHSIMSHYQYLIDYAINRRISIKHTTPRS